jgi:hypothetical protein
MENVFLDSDISNLLKNTMEDNAEVRLWMCIGKGHFPPLLFEALAFSLQGILFHHNAFHARNGSLNVCG